MSADVASHPAGQATEAEAIDRKWKLHQELTIEKVLEKQQQHQPHQQQQPVANQHQQQDPEEEPHQPPLEKHLNSEEHPNSQPYFTQPEDQTQIEDANAIEIARLRQQVLELQVKRMCCRARDGMLDLEGQRKKFYGGLGDGIVVVVYSCFQNCNRLAGIEKERAETRHAAEVAQLEQQQQQLLLMQHLHNLPPHDTRSSPPRSTRSAMR
jgi:hypothetical protein